MAYSAFEEALAKRSLPSPRRRGSGPRADCPSGTSAGRLASPPRRIALYEKGKRTPRGEHLVRYVSLLAELAGLDALIQESAR